MPDPSKSILLGLLAASLHAASPEEILTTQLTEPDADRWMYSFNGTPGTRATASTFSALPQPQQQTAADDRFGQFLIRFNTAAAGIPTGLGPSNYKIHHITLTAVIAQNGGTSYDLTPDPLSSFGPTPSPDPDPGRPIELHGTGFRNSFTPSSFQETSLHGFGPPGSRNAFALGFDLLGNPRDVSNNITQNFDPIPWATATFQSLTPGNLVPDYAIATFHINTSLPGVANYLAESLDRGFLWLTVSSLHSATQMGSEGFPAFFTRDHPEHAVFGDVAPRLNLSWSLPLTIHHFSRNQSENTARLDWNASPGFIYQIQSTTDPANPTWTTHPPLTTPQPTILSWQGPAPEPRSFFRVTRTPAP